MRSERNRWLTAYALVVYVFLFLPIVILIIFSFNAAAASRLTLRSMPTGGTSIGPASRSTGTRRCSRTS